jgi:Inner membrane protein YgaP-like, transmembrane domain
MKMQLLVRRFAGAFILASLLLAQYHSLYWLWFTAFVGFNLLQSSFTHFCPLEMILKKLGVGRDAGSGGEIKPAQAASGR